VKIGKGAAAFCQNLRDLHRKSSDEGLEQLLIPLHAERDACAAPIPRKSTRAGRFCPPFTTTVDFPAARGSGRPANAHAGRERWAPEPTLRSKTFRKPAGLRRCGPPQRQCSGTRRAF